MALDCSHCLAEYEAGEILEWQVRPPLLDRPECGMHAAIMDAPQGRAGKDAMANLAAFGLVLVLAAFSAAPWIIRYYLFKWALLGGSTAGALL